MEALQSPVSAPPGDRLSPGASRNNQVARAIVVAIILCIAPFLCLRMSFVTDADVWWHMRSGQLILLNHAVPHTDPFSTLGPGIPWAAYSWLFDLLMLKLFQFYGLVGFVLYSTAVVLSISVALYHLVKRLQPDLAFTALLVFIAAFSLSRNYTPRSWLVSILFFTLQLDILMQARKTGKTRELLWLPVIYLLWANLHIQFIDGLLVLALALGETILAHWWTSARTRLNPSWIGSIFAACILIACANPFGWHIYAIAYRAASQPGPLQLVSEFNALAFRSLPDYLMLFLALGAAASLAASRGQSSGPRFPVFEIGLLAFAAVVSFRCGRDMWVMVIVASALIAQALGNRGAQAAPANAQSSTLPTILSLPIIAVTIVLLLFGTSRVYQVNNRRLQVQVSDILPVRAVDFVRQNNFAGPLFNNFDWGGYLIWDLRMPVSMDGRCDFYGDRLLERSFATWGGKPSWNSDPQLQSAGLVIAELVAPLTQLLRTDPRFQLVYEDNQAAVFIARRLHESPAASPPSTR